MGWGFSRAIGIITSIQTKLRALKDGLVLAIKLEIPNLEIEMNSLDAIELIKSAFTTNVLLSFVVGDCTFWRGLNTSLSSTYLEKPMCVLMFLPKLVVLRSLILFLFPLPQAQRMSWRLCL